ncbi:MAG: zinc ribbon domain-containing protein [Halobacteriota archaeon]|jgi:hypothetical protein
MTENTRCTQCGATNPTDSRFCERCGAQIHPVAENSPVQSSEQLTSSQPPPKRLNRRYMVYAVVAIVVVAAVASIPYFFRQTDYTNQITTYYQGLGFSIVKPFEHTTVFGADAYVGTVGKNLTIANETIFPRSSDTDAESFQQTVVNRFELQGFVTLHTVAGVWYGVTNNSEVGVSALFDGGSPTGNPAVLVMQMPLSAGPATSSAQASTGATSSGTAVV